VFWRSFPNGCRYRKAESQPFGLTFFYLVDYSDKTSNLIKDLNRLYLFAIEVL